MSKKSYADECLERASKATAGPWIINKQYGAGNIFKIHLKEPSISCSIKSEDTLKFIAHSRTDVVELATRLKMALEIIDNYHLINKNYDIEAMVKVLEDSEPLKVSI